MSSSAGAKRMSPRAPGLLPVTAQVDRPDGEAGVGEAPGEPLVAPAVLAEAVHERDGAARRARPAASRARRPRPSHRQLLGFGLAHVLELRPAAALARCATARTVAGISASTEIPTAHQNVAANAAASGSASRARTSSGRRSSVPVAAAASAGADR